MLRWKGWEWNEALGHFVDLGPEFSLLIRQEGIKQNKTFVSVAKVEGIKIQKIPCSWRWAVADRNNIHFHMKRWLLLVQITKAVLLLKIFNRPLRINFT
jgi:hypothetical protein